jgi:hypothetical protein
VGAIEDGQVLYSILPRCVVVTKDVALAYKFSGKYKGYIKVREDTLHKSQLDGLPLEDLGNKFKYDLTEEDKKNACLFEKASMIFMLNKYYLNKLNIFNSTPDFLKQESFESAEYLLNRKNEIYQKILSCQNWVETGILLNDHFGVHYDTDSSAKIDL